MQHVKRSSVVKHLIESTRKSIERKHMDKAQVVSSTLRAASGKQNVDSIMVGSVV
jgi:hypothetical protein